MPATFRRTIQFPLITLIAFLLSGCLATVETKGALDACGGCPQGTICTEDLTCTPLCTTNAHCSDCQVCGEDGLCMELADCGSDEPCSGACTDEQICISDLCHQSCNSDLDCANNEVCSSINNHNVCVATVDPTTSSKPARFQPTLLQGSGLTSNPQFKLFGGFLPWEGTPQNATYSLQPMAE